LSTCGSVAPSLRLPPETYKPSHATVSSLADELAWAGVFSHRPDPEATGDELRRVVRYRGSAGPGITGSSVSPIKRYVRWTRDDGTAFDPWIRIHLRLGAAPGPVLPKSLRIAATIRDWEMWTGMRFPESVFPEGLSTLPIDTNLDRGEYWEPNVWLVDRVSA